MIKAQEVVSKAVASQSIQTVPHKSGVLCGLGRKMIPANSQKRAAAWSAITNLAGTINAELRLRGINDLECVARSVRKQLDWMFSGQHERAVNQDNTMRTCPFGT